MLASFLLFDNDNSQNTNKLSKKLFFLIIEITRIDELASYDFQEEVGEKRVWETLERKISAIELRLMVNALE